jgi:hypothetical protein
MSYGILFEIHKLMLLILLLHLGLRATGYRHRF